MKTCPLGELLEEAKVGFACGRQDDAGIFQIRMNNVTPTAELDLQARRRVPLEAVPDFTVFSVRAGDVLLNITNSIDNVGKSALIRELPEAAVFSNHFLRLRVNNQVLDPAYLWRWLQKQYAVGALRGLAKQWVNQATIDRQRLLTLDFPLPSLSEQRRIASILDQADAIRTKRQETIALLEALPAAQFQRTFHGWPAGETVEAIASSAPNSVRTGPFGSQLLHSEFVDSGVAVLGLDNVVQNRFEWVESRHISFEKYASLRRYTVHPGDVLISIMGTVGRCVVVPEEVPLAINTKHICAVSPDTERIRPEFLRAAFLWHPDSRAYLRRQTKGSIMAGLNMGIIKRMPVPIPPLALQDDFIKLTAAAAESCEIARRALKHDEELFASLQSRAFRGEL